MAKGQIDWTPELIELLLECVLQFGPHVAPLKERGEAWKKIFNAFYADNRAVGLVKPAEPDAASCEKNKQAQ